MFKIYLAFIVPGSMIIPLAVILARYNKAPVYAKWLFAYLVMSALLNITGIVIAKNHMNNLWVFHVYTIVESFLILYYFKLIIKNKRVNIAIRILLWAFPFYCVINFLFLQSFYSFNTYTRPLEAIIFIMLCAIYWWQDGEEDAETGWGDIPNNWIITGIMLYFAGAFFLFLFSNYLFTGISKESRNMVTEIAWVTHGSFVLIMYLLFGIGFMKCRK